MHIKTVFLISEYKPCIWGREEAEAHSSAQPFVSYVDIDKVTQHAGDSWYSG